MLTQIISLLFITALLIFVYCVSWYTLLDTIHTCLDWVHFYDAVSLYIAQISLKVG